MNLRRYSKRFLLVMGSLALASSGYGYRCPGKLCDLPCLTPSDCANYSEMLEVDPMTPAIPSKVRVLVGAVKDESCNQSGGTLTLAVTQTYTDQETVNATGSVAANVGVDLKAGISAAVGVTVSGGVTNTTSTSFSYATTYAIAVTATYQMTFQKCQKAYINAYIWKYYGNFANAGRMWGSWDNSNACYEQKCAETSGSGYGQHYSPVVTYEHNILACQTCAGC